MTFKGYSLKINLEVKKMEKMCAECYKKHIAIDFDINVLELSYNKYVCDECGRKMNVVVNAPEYVVLFRKNTHRY